MRTYERHHLPHNDGFVRPLEYRLLTIGNLHEAAEESFAWLELYDAIREARIKFQREGIPPHWETLTTLLVKNQLGIVSNQ